MTPTPTPTPNPLRVSRVDVADNLTLEYASQGRHGGAATLLLLHGITDSWRSFEGVMPHLPADWHVIALTQRGHGGSGKPTRADGDSGEPRPAYRTRDFAADAAALVRALHLPPLVVVGHSMGAANAMRFAIDHPMLVRGVVAAGAFASFGDKPELAAFVREQIAPLVDPIPRELAQAFQQDTIARPVAPGLLDGLLDTAVDESLRVPAHVWREAFEQLLTDDFRAGLSRITMPVLLVQGAADVFVPEADTQRLLRELPHARASVWAGAGHAMHWEEPARFADEIVRFVSALGA